MIPDEPTLLEVFRHHAWANVTLFRFCEPLRAGELASTALGTFGTVYDTLLHIARAEQWYLADLTGSPRIEPIERGERPPVSGLTRLMELTGAGLLQAAGNMTTRDVARWSDRGPKESMLSVRLAIQTLDHGSEHRTQVRTILSQIGLTPPELDAWAYDALQPDGGDYLAEGPRSG